MNSSQSCWYFSCAYVARRLRLFGAVLSNIHVPFLSIEPMCDQFWALFNVKHFEFRQFSVGWLLKRITDRTFYNVRASKSISNLWMIRRSPDFEALNL